MLAGVGDVASMPTVITHTAVPLALRAAAGRRIVSPRLLAAAVLASALPDADVVTFALGIPYGHPFGHRGFFHSPSFAVVLGVLGCLAWRRLGVSRTAAFRILFLSAASHGLLDAATDGGLGVAFFSPFSNRRYFLPWRPIHVSPLSLFRFASAQGEAVLQSEVLWVWVPCLLIGVALFLLRSRRDY